MDINQRLLDARKKKGLSAKDAAQHIGIAASKLSRIENAHPLAAPLTLEELTRACTLYNCSADWLLGLVEHSPFRPDLQTRLSRIPPALIREMIERPIYCLYDILDAQMGLLPKDAIPQKNLKPMRKPRLKTQDNAP